MQTTKDEIMDLVQDYGQELKDYGHTSEASVILGKIEELLNGLIENNPTV